MSLPYEHKLINRAKELRRTATRQEKHLWHDYLKDYPLRFQRQKSIGNYIVDFYCHSARLAIELDGSQHFEEEGLRYDAVRSEFLKSRGIAVLRIANCDVDRNFEGVCEQIDQSVKTRVNSLSHLR